MIFIRLFLFCFAFILSTSSYSSKFPQTKEEKLRDEIGTITKGGFTFRPYLSKNESTKKTINSNNAETKVNKFLWISTKEILSKMPLVVQDLTSGSIITDWYSVNSNPDYAYKVEVLINDDVIAPESIIVKVFEKEFKNNRWINKENISETLSNKISHSILEHAREKFVSENNN